MTRIAFAFLVIPLLALVSFGCNGADCVSLCQESSDRGCLFYELGTGSCEGDCQLAEDLASRSGCDAEWNDYLACEASEADICDSTCSAEERRVSDCATAYCVANIDEPACRRAAGL